jgi:hypothetical protein
MLKNLFMLNRIKQFGKDARLFREAVARSKQSLDAKKEKKAMGETGVQTWGGEQGSVGEMLRNGKGLENITGMEQEVTLLFTTTDYEMVAKTITAMLMPLVGIKDLKTPQVEVQGDGSVNQSGLSTTSVPLGKLYDLSEKIMRGRNHGEKMSALLKTAIEKFVRTYPDLMKPFNDSMSGKSPDYVKGVFKSTCSRVCSCCN